MQHFSKFHQNSRFRKKVHKKIKIRCEDFASTGLSYVQSVPLIRFYCHFRHSRTFHKHTVRRWIFGPLNFIKFFTVNSYGSQKLSFKTVFDYCAIRMVYIFLQFEKRSKTNILNIGNGNTQINIFSTST